MMKTARSTTSSRAAYTDKNKTMTLIKTSTPDSQITLSESAAEAKKTLTMASSEITEVKSPEESTAAKAVIARIDTHMKDFEKARVAAKAPFLEICQKLDALSREHVASLDSERKRLSRIAAGFDAEQLRKAQEEAAAAQRKDEEEERERRKAIAEAEKKQREAEQSGDEAAKLEAEILAETANQAPAKAVVVAPIPEHLEGIRMKTEITVTDIKALYAAHPMFVRLEPDLRMIRAAIDSGQTLPGVKVERVPDVAKRRGV